MSSKAASSKARNTAKGAVAPSPPLLRQEEVRLGHYAHIDAGMETLTVFAFSTNWKCEKAETDALMKLVVGFVRDILSESLTRNIRVKVLGCDSRELPAFLVKSINYGARDDIVGACKMIATEIVQGQTSVDDIDEDLLNNHMLTAGLPDADIKLRTSGELRIGNFLLYQIAYVDLICMDK